MPPQINRRDLLKLIGVIPFLKIAWPYARPFETASPDTRRPNVLILIFDAVSADHVSIHGYGRETTPNLARFAKRSTVYHSCYSAGNFTTPGTASLLTGVYPWSHRALHLHGVVADPYIERNIFNLFPEDTFRVAYTHNLLVTSLLHQFGGYLDHFKPTRDLCLIDDEYSDKLFSKDYNVSFWGEWLILRGDQPTPSSLFLSLAHRVLRFAHKHKLTKEYGELFPRGIPNLHNLIFILEHAIDWIQDQLIRLPQPFLGFFHLLPPHEPYFTRRDFIDRFADGWTPMAKAPHHFSEGHSDESLNEERRHYDEYLAYADAEFGRLLNFMEDKGILDSTYVLITSDHGEMFERGIRGHVTPTLYEPILHVPLLISQPGQEQRHDVFEPVSAVDVLPTLLHISGQKVPAWCEGELLPGFGGKTGKSDRSIYAVEAKSNPKYGPLEKTTIAMIKNQIKLIHYLGYNGFERTFELYDLSNDPMEQDDLSFNQSSVMVNLQREFEEKLNEVNQPYFK